MRRCVVFFVNSIRRISLLLSTNFHTIKRETSNMVENGFIYATVVFTIVSAFVGGVLFIAIQAMNKEGKRPGEH
jgi:hypothetical protein